MNNEQTQSLDRLLQVGSLQYSYRRLIVVVLWLCVGIFGFALMRVTPALLLPLTFKRISDSNLILGLLLGSIPAAMNFIVTPVVSFKSDRTRSKWGRRRPYLFIASPFIAIALILIGLASQYMTWLRLPLEWQTIGTIAILGILIIIYQFFCMFVASVIY